jgi:hypothetical protein
VRRELDLIVKKCLAKDPGERYATANELAADLRNWLAGKPITARPVGPIAAGWKWARRNPGVSLSLALAMLAMLAGTGVSLRQAAVARQEAERADAEAEKARNQAQHANAEAEKARLQAEQIAAQLQESQRLLDLGRLREAEADYDRSLVQSAIDKLDAIAPKNRCVAWGIMRRRVDGADLILRGHRSGVSSVAVSSDGRRILTRSNLETFVWDAESGRRVDEPIPPSANSNFVTFNGLEVIPVHNSVLLYDPRISPEELIRRRWITRPRPDLHAKLAQDYKSDPWASAVQRSLEQRALGLLAVEALQLYQAQAYFLAAEMLKPKLKE